MNVELVQQRPGDLDVVCVGVLDDAELPGEVASAPGSDDVLTRHGALTLLRPDGARLLVCGLGSAEKLDAERLRSVAARAARSASGYARTLAWELPELERVDPGQAASAIVEGAVLAGYRFDRFRDPPPGEEGVLEQLVIVGPAELAEPVRTGEVGARAQNRARDLQNLPANLADPAYLAARAEEIAGAHGSVTAEILDREQIVALGMGGLAAVSQASQTEPRLIVLRYDGGAGGAPLGLIGKGVTFDSGGISLKPAGKMHEMKMDMSGAAAVLETVAAVAELGLGVDVLAVVPATDNMPGGRAIHPGDVITQYNGTTVEVNNTDAEGRLILADALAWAAEQGASPLVDIATLTGAVVVALGSTHAGLIANDDEIARRVEAAGMETGELVWRLPLHDEYRELMKGTIADLVNTGRERKAGTITGGVFLERMVGETPWAHLDIAGTAWGQGRDTVGKGPSGFGVRLLLALVRAAAAAA